MKVKILEPKNIILFIGTVSDAVIVRIREYEKTSGEIFRIALLFDAKAHAKERTSFEGLDLILPCDTSLPESIRNAIAMVGDGLLAVSVRGERNLPFFKKVRPFIAAHASSLEALECSTDNALMRKKLREHKKTLCPRFTVVRDAEKDSIDAIEQKVGFPLVIKPIGITSGSVLMNVCYYREELEKMLPKVFRKMRSLTSVSKHEEDQAMLIEQFLEGEVYSFDAYITPRGKVYLCPPIEIRPGRTVGFDDLFSYMQITPPTLSPMELQTAEAAVRDALQALGLSSTSAHVEIIRSDDAWKVVSMSPVLSGWRNDLYMLSYGIDHLMNDILVRIPRRPVFSTRVERHSAVIRFYARKEGKLLKLSGMKKIKELVSFFRLRTRKRIGDMCRYAKNGDVPIFDVTLSNTSRTALLADIRRAEQAVEITTS